MTKKGLPGKKRDVHGFATLDAQGKYHSEGSIQTLATAVWRLYKSLLCRSHGVGRFAWSPGCTAYYGQKEQDVNEALVIQKDGTNSVDGVLLRVFGVIEHHWLSYIRELLKSKPYLKLYIYDPRQTKNHLRVLSSKQVGEGGVWSWVLAKSTWEAQKKKRQEAGDVRTSPFVAALLTMHKFVPCQLSTGRTAPSA